MADNREEPPMDWIKKMTTCATSSITAFDSRPMTYFIYTRSPVPNYPLIQRFCFPQDKDDD